MRVPRGGALILVMYKLILITMLFLSCAGQRVTERDYPCNDKVLEVIKRTEAKLDSMMEYLDMK